MAFFMMADMSVPLGIAMGVLYTAVILISLWLPRKVTILVAIISSVLIIIAFLYKPPVPYMWKAVCNRGLALFAVWITAILGLQRKKAEEMREEALRLREKALNEIRILRGILPVCSWCKKVRNDQNIWIQIEKYIKEHSEADFSHSLCPECANSLYPEYASELHRKINLQDARSETDQQSDQQT
jgi:hypothetical protein